MLGSKEVVLVVAFSVLSCCTVELRSQQSKSPIVLSDLRSPDWERRKATFERIKADQDEMQRRDVRAALVDLLSFENRVVHKVLVDSKGQFGVSERLGEGYSEYVSDLAGTVEGIADWLDPRQVCVLAQSSYEPDSPLATKLAVEGGADVAPCLLKMAQGNIYDRHESIPVLVQLLSVTKNLSPTVQQQIQQTIIAGLRDTSVRMVAVNAVGKFGKPEVIPTLEEIARTDPYSRRLLDGSLRFDIREAATKAIDSIRERTKVN